MLVVGSPQEDSTLEQNRIPWSLPSFPQLVEWERPFRRTVRGQEPVGIARVRDEEEPVSHDALLLGVGPVWSGVQILEEPRSFWCTIGDPEFATVYAVVGGEENSLSQRDETMRNG